MENNGLYGCYDGFRAIILHTFRVQVGFRVLASQAEPDLAKRGYFDDRLTL